MDYILTSITSDFHGNGKVKVDWKITKDGDCINTFNGLWSCNIVTNECIDQIKPQMLKTFIDSYKKLLKGEKKYEVCLDN